MSASLRRARVARISLSVSCAAIAVGGYVAFGSWSAARATSKLTAPSTLYLPRKTGMLDCNGRSLTQKFAKLGALCTDVRGEEGVRTANNYDDRSWDNGEYIGHDEPDLTYHSTTAGSGNNVTWTETIGTDPTAPPTATTPGKDVTDWFELTLAPWMSMQMCDPDSYPQLPCTPESDGNAPSCVEWAHCAADAYPGGGSTFMEFQLYPPGDPPFVDSASCNDKQWCAALTLDSLECTKSGVCNDNCFEPQNFGFIQTNGIPTGPPSPQLSDLSSYTPNKDTLLMNPGDTIKIHMWDAPVPKEKGSKAFEVSVVDETTHQSGWMQASATNGFAQTSIATCDGSPFNFQPSYSTAGTNEISPWAALQTNISTEFETGHFEPCTSVEKPQVLNVDGIQDRIWFKCVGPYESAPDTGGPETSDAACYPKGDTHYLLGTEPDTLTGCFVDFLQNGDLDFDGPPYYQQWPTSTSSGPFPGSFVESQPTTNGKQYSSFFLQTDIALSELNTGCGPAKPSKCTVPPSGPGNFYPYWSEVDSHGTCTWEFGNVSGGSTTNTFGKDKQYGLVQLKRLGFPEFEGPSHDVSCPVTDPPTR